jgi:hypothetical protein
MQFASLEPNCLGDGMFKAAYLLFLFLIALFTSIYFVNLPLSVIVAGLLIFSAVAVAMAACRIRFGRSTPAMIFFFLAAAHALFGYLTAEPSSEAISIAGSPREVFQKAFIIVALGLAATATGYGFAVQCRFARLQSWVAGLHVNDDRFALFSRIALIAGVLLMGGISWHIGYLPLLSENPGAQRYITADLSPAYRVYEWFIARATDLLRLALPFLLCFALQKRRRTDLLLVFVGCIALEIPLRRAPILSAIMIFVVTRALHTRKISKRLVALFLLAAVLAAFSQIVFFGAVGSSHRAMVAIGSTFSEVRDLGWILSLSRDHRFYGLPLLEPFMPLPSFMSDFFQKYSMRVITTKLIGLDTAGDTGGLRLTLSGEGYLNFGYPGTILLGSLFGVMLAASDVLMQTVIRSGTLATRYLAASIFVWLAWWTYLAGTQAGGAIKSEVALVGLITLLSSERRIRPLVQPSRILRSVQ